MALGPAIAATSSAADVSFSPPAPAPTVAVAETSSAADLAPTHAVAPAAADASLVMAPVFAPTPTPGPAVVATSSAADVSLISPSATPVSGFAPTQAVPAPAMLFAAQTLSPSLAVSAETASAGGTTLTLGPANAAGSSAMLAVASVFSSDPGPGLAGTGAGQVAGSSDLPFMDDSGAGDTPIYTASDETPWIFVSDFGGDWFFV
jgi:hypothetical protein